MPPAPSPPRHSSPSRVHIVGAGLAGLATATRLTEMGVAVTLYDSAGHAGGRCRSFHEPALDRQIDNGNHLMLGANRALFAYLDRIGSGGGLVSPESAVFPFLDLETRACWTLRPSRGRLPWWIFIPSARVPRSRWSDYLALLRLALAPAHATVAEVLGGPGTALYLRLWKPLCEAVLNADPSEAAASLLWPVVRETFGRGEAACRAYVARNGLSPDLVDPALRYIESRGGTIRLNRRLRAVAREGERAVALDFTAGPVALGANEWAVLALPPAILGRLLPDVTVPEGAHAIVNGHFRLDAPAALPHELPFLGLVGGTAHWLFARGDVVSVTVSAADRLAEETNDAVAALLWADIARALGRPAGAPPPPWRIVIEKRATFAQTPANACRRPGARIGWANLLLAGDWTATGLPATIESAVASGHEAASILLNKFNKY